MSPLSPGLLRVRHMAAWFLILESKRITRHAQVQGLIKLNKSISLAFGEKSRFPSGFNSFLSVSLSSHMSPADVPVPLRPGTAADVPRKGSSHQVSLLGLAHVLTAYWYLSLGCNYSWHFVPFPDFTAIYINVVCPLTADEEVILRVSSWHCGRDKWQDLRVTWLGRQAIHWDECFLSQNHQQYVWACTKVIQTYAGFVLFCFPFLQCFPEIFLFCAWVWIDLHTKWKPGTCEHVWTQVHTWNSMWNTGIQIVIV